MAGRSSVRLSHEVGEVETQSVEGEGDRVASLSLLRADPITLTLDAARLDLSRA
jgi:hypothetical protein